MRVIRWDDGTRWDDPNARWGDPSYLLEPGDPGYIAPTPTKPKKKGRKHMASNPTPDAIDELIAAGEDMYDGLNQHAVAIGIKQNDPAGFRTKLDALITTQALFKAAESAQTGPYTQLRTADSNAKGFIAAAVKVLAISLGGQWSDAWIATGLPDNKVGVPSTQDKRFAALGGLKAFFTANPDMEVTTAKITVTAALATTRYEAFSDARQAVGNALTATATAFQPREAALDKFRAAYRSTINEIGDVLEDDDPKWYDFGLVRPIDGDQPGIPMNVVATALGGGKVLVQCVGARRANSFNYYRKIVGTDPDPVKVTNDISKTLVIDALPVGATVEATMTAVNEAGEGHASSPVSVVVT
ncbi:MAG: hypothetical protein PCFJNLEI_03620 [Verrucomicrobiae bacterium]|nr:hypothetical protein [Verrucomicrobiae bacterium]